MQMNPMQMFDTSQAFDQSIAPVIEEGIVNLEVEINNNGENSPGSIDEPSPTNSNEGLTVKQIMAKKETQKLQRLIEKKIKIQDL